MEQDNEQKLNAYLQYLAKWANKPIHTRLEYFKQACILTVNAEDFKMQRDEIIRRVKQEQPQAGYCLLRLLRNAEALNNIRQPMSKETARVITDYWTDSEILSNFSANDEAVLANLQRMLEYWQNDRTGGFMIEGATDEQRAAARAGNYGEYIQQIMSKAKQPQQPKLNMQSREQIITYLCTTANIDIDKYAEELRNFRKKSSILANISLWEMWKNPKIVRSVNTRGKNKPLIEYAPWLRLWNDAYALNITLYKPKQIKEYIKEKLG